MARLAIRATGDGMREKVTAFDDEALLRITVGNRDVAHVVVRENRDGVHIVTMRPWSYNGPHSMRRDTLAQVTVKSETHSA